MPPLPSHSTMITNCTAILAAMWWLHTNTASAGITITIQPDSYGNAVFSLSVFGTTTTRAGTSDLTTTGAASFANISGLSGNSPFNTYFCAFNGDRDFSKNDLILETPLEMDFGGTSYFLERAEFEDDGASSGIDDFSIAFSNGMVNAGCPLPGRSSVDYSVIASGTSRILDGAAPIPFAGNFNVGTFTVNSDDDTNYLNGMQLVITSEVASGPPAPEPSSFAMIGLGLVFIIWCRRARTTAGLQTET